MSEVEHREPPQSTRDASYAQWTSVFEADRVLDEHGWPIRERCDRRRFLLGIFLPNVNGGYIPLNFDVPTQPTFAYNLACTRLCEQLDYDFVFQVGRWAGYGGPTERWWNWFTLDPITTVAALAAATSKIMLLSTWHILYHFHPVHVAKLGANIDHISGGRWGLNIVTGWNSFEAALFGGAVPPLEQRYRMAAEVVRFLKQAWTRKEPFGFAGEFYNSYQALLLPKPVQKPYPLLVNAGSSGPGVEFATSQCDWLFSGPGVGKVIEGRQNLDGVLDDCRRLSSAVRERAAAHGRTLKIISCAVLIVRDTEREALEMKRLILEQGDWESARHMGMQRTSGDHSLAVTPELSQAELQACLFSGAAPFFGTPEQAAELLIGQAKAGIDGFQIIFFDYLHDIQYFADRVIPALAVAGLRDFV